MEYVQELTLELNSNTAYTTVGAKQGDNNSRIIRVHLTQNGEDYTIPSGASAYFRFRKPDGKAIINVATIEDNTIYIVLTSQTLAAAGRGYGDITLQSGSDILSTVSFILIIMSAPDVVSQVVSSNEFGYLNAIVADATNTIYESEAWARGTRGGVDVVSTSIFSPSFGPISSTIQAISVDQSVFMAKVGSTPGASRVYTYTWTVNNNWQLQSSITQGATTTNYDPELVNNLSTYGITYNTTSGVNPNTGDWIKVEVAEPDSTYQNNAKYYSEQAAESRHAIENLTVTGEKVFADEFDATEEYEVDDYVWYENYLYRFTTHHYPGQWNANEVVEEILIDKTVAEGTASFHFHIPQGQTGNVYFMTFEIDPEDGQLYMYKPRKLVDQVNFEIIGSGDNEGCLGVIINTGGES